jgi:hypothetical protein
MCVRLNNLFILKTSTIGRFTLLTFPTSCFDKRNEMLNSDKLRNNLKFLVMSVHVNKRLIKMLIIDGQPADQNTTVDGIFCYKQTTSVFL